MIWQVSLVKQKHMTLLICTIMHDYQNGALELLLYKGNICLVTMTT